MRGKTNLRWVSTFLTAAVLGALIVLEIKSLQDVNDILVRDGESNVFQEIKILRNTNNDLSDEVNELDRTLEQLNDRNLALDAIETEINKYMRLTGDDPVFGAGLEVALDANVSTALIVDLVNEFFTAGAEAVSINEIRLSNETMGFDTLPQGQILLNGSILTPPFNFKVIGEPNTVLEVLELPGGIFDRIEAVHEGIEITALSKEIIQLQ